MKKLLLFSLLISFAIAGVSQSEPVQMNQKRTENQLDFKRTTNFPEVDMTKETTSVERIAIGSAKSQRSFRREDTKTISYNKDLDVISISFVLDKDIYPSIDEDGVVGMFYSADRGLTWSDPVVISDFTDEGLENYYLSCILYNPTGNTDVDNAYGVFQGICAEPPSYPIWNRQAFGSSQLNGDNLDQEYITNSATGFEHDGYFNQFGLTQKSNFIKCFNIIPEGPWAEFSELQIENIQANFNGDNFDWEIEQSIIEMPFAIDEDGEAMWVGKLTFSDVAADVVWSDDGQIGYAWMVGVHEDATTGFQPIMYKTTDGGDNWDDVDLDFQSEEAQEAMLYDLDTGEGYIFPCNTAGEEPLDYCIPWFNATVGAVDHRGNLQLFGDMNGHYYGEGQAPEAADVYSRFSYAGHLMKFTIGEDESGNDGLLDIMWVDSLRSTPALDLVDATDDNLYCGTNGWLRRLQLSKNEFSNEFFLTWTDTRDGDGLVENFHPDIVGWSYNSHYETHSEPVCLTEGSLYETFYFYVQAAENAMYDLETNTYTVPMLNALSVNDFSSNTSASGDPVDVHYVTGMTFPSLTPDPPIGLDKLENADWSVTQNSPNPFSTFTTISINSSKTANVSVEVSNLMGQSVYSMDAGIINGNMKLNIPAKDLKAGVYFYTVTIGNESVSKKMIVE